MAGALKTAKELVKEIGLAVQPPEGAAIVLTEHPGALPNWVAAAGIMEAALTDKFSGKGGRAEEDGFKRSAGGRVGFASALFGAGGYRRPCGRKNGCTSSTRLGLGRVSALTYLRRMIASAV